MCIKWSGGKLNRPLMRYDEREAGHVVPNPPQLLSRGPFQEAARAHICAQMQAQRQHPLLSICKLAD